MRYSNIRYSKKSIFFYLKRDFKFSKKNMPVIKMVVMEIAEPMNTNRPR